MTIETTNSLEQGKNLSPFSVEKIEPISIPKVEVKNDKLYINGVIQEKYSWVDQSSNRKEVQKNNPDLLYFQAKDADTAEEAGRDGRVIDINNPEKELLTVGADKDKNILVNGNKWDSLRGKQVYFGGYRVEVDPEGKKVVFCEVGHENQSVIVNNNAWKTKFDGIRFATSRFGTPYAVGEVREKDNIKQQKLVIDDAEWTYPQFIPDKNSGNRFDIDNVQDAVIGKNGQVAAAIDSIRTKDRRTYIFTGDKIGAKNEWKNTLNKVEKMIINDETGDVAVFGESEYNSKKMILLVNDTPLALEGNPENLEVFKFENNAVVIQYADALGEKTTEKIMLREDAKEVQGMKEKNEANEKAFEELRRLLIRENIPANEIAARLKKSEDLGKEVEKNKSLSARIGSVEEEKMKLQMKIEQDDKTHQKEIRELELKATNAEMALKKLQQILKGADKATFGSGFKIGSDDMKLALESIEKTLGK